jgi:very-short-patch-repair endonuclease
LREKIARFSGVSPLSRGAEGCVINKIFYDPKLKELARRLRNNSTKAEIKLWGYLKGRQLRGYDFHRQKPVGNYIVDFFCNSLMLAIEADGYTHSFDKVFERDGIKEQRLNELGITILRITDEYVIKDIEGVLAYLEKYIISMEEGRNIDTPQPSG